MKKLFILSILCLFALQACQNPCEFTLCDNGGQCVNGSCECPDGYSGTTCGQEDVPAQVLLKSITISDFPSTKSRNLDWDNNNGPDLYFVLNKGEEMLYKEESIIENAGASINYQFEALNLGLDSPEATYELILFDADEGAEDDMIGRLEFIPYRQGGGFPRKFSIKDGGLDLDFDVAYLH